MRVAELESDARRRAEISLALGRALFSTGDYAGAQGVLGRGLAELPDVDDDLSLELHAWYVTLARQDRELPPLIQARFVALLDGEEPGRTPSERLLLVQLGYESALSGARPREQVARLARRALADGALLQDCGTDAGPYGAACYVLAFAGEPDAAIAELERAIDLSQRRGSRVAFGWFSLVRGGAHYLRGDLIQALVDLQSTHDTYTEEYALDLPQTRALMALCLLERDDLANANDALILPGDEESWAALPSFNSYLYALGRLKTAEGQVREGLNTLLECGRRVLEMNFLNPAANLPWRSEAALLAARLGEADHALELVRDDLKLARAFGAPQAIGIALRVAGLIEGGDRGLEQLAKAVALLDGTGSNLELARTLTEQGAALRRAGHRGEARQPLRRGLDLTTSCGALAVARRAREELIAAGARPRRQRIRGADALTASELRVARMAANGKTNRQIAQSLFITIRTVTTHLGHAYQKLDITGREQLADKLAEESATGVGVS